MLIPLGFKYPMQIFPGATFRYRTCATNGSVAFLRTDLMHVPSTTRANATAYSIHTWAKVSSQVQLNWKLAQSEPISLDQ